MTLQQIYYALTVAETGSMNKAAEKLFISQPSLTAAIKELEKFAGVKLFHRTAKGMEKTPDGEEFLTYARPIYQQYELLSQKYGGKTLIKRKFGVSTQHYSFAVKAFIETVKAFDTKEYEFAIRETRTLDVINDVSVGRSEIGILYLSDFNRKFMTKTLADNELIFHPLKKCGVYVYIAKTHPLASQKKITFKELHEYPCLSFEQGGQSSLFLSEEILAENHYPRIIKACDRATLLNLMKGLNGYTLCSGIISSELNGDDYVSIPFAPDEESHPGVMEIGYITKKYGVLGDIAISYVLEIKKSLGAI
ncbi:MAG: LysR family transcriptional regulator [Ruminococcus sp.]|jgi:DNA-binding transcriptional LysR family regulator|nr:LysR family transcriptional regulator [Ruminococcus sp.]